MIEKYLYLMLTRINKKINIYISIEMMMRMMKKIPFFFSYVNIFQKQQDFLMHHSFYLFKYLKKLNFSNNYEIMLKIF